MKKLHIIPKCLLCVCVRVLLVVVLLCTAVEQTHAQTTAQPTCQGTVVLTSPSGTFRDRTSTSATYGNNLDCFWLIQPNGTVTDGIIALDFQAFNTELNYDVVRIYDGADTTARLLGTFSGRSIPARLSSSGKTVLVRFTTDPSVASAGWRLSYALQPPPQIMYQRTTLTSLSGIFRDRTSTSATYENNTDSFWLIQPSGTVTNSTITLQPKSFNTEEGRDIIRIYDGADTTARLFGTFSGRSIPARLYSSGKTMLIRFTTDRSVAAAGWSFEYWTQPQVLTAPFQWFGVTDYYSRGERPFYVNNDRRSWLIRPQGARRIALRFGEFDTEEGADEVRVYDGTDTTAPLLGRFSGSVPPPAPIFSSGGAMFVTFSSNEDLVRNAGWNAYYIGEFNAPLLQTSEQSITLPSTAVGDTATKLYHISASGLRSSVTITAPPGFVLSQTPTGTFGRVLEYMHNGNGFIVSAPVYLRFIPQTRALLSDSIQHTTFSTQNLTLLLTQSYIRVQAESYIRGLWEPTSGPSTSAIAKAFSHIGNTIFLGTGVGVYRTTSNGAIWQYSGLSEYVVWDFTAIDSVVYAACGQFGNDSVGGIFRSSNKGITWEQVYRGSGVLAIIAKGSELIAEAFRQGLIKSTDGGRTWVTISSQFRATWESDSMAVRSLIVQDNVIIAGTHLGGVFRSTDDGTTWIRSSEGYTGSYLEKMAKNSKSIFIASIGGFFRSNDRGQTWERLFGENLHIYGVVAVGDVIIAATLQKGIYRSEDNGETWQVPNTPIAQAIQDHGFVKDGDIYMSAGGEIARSTNLGLTWSYVSEGLNAPIPFTMRDCGRYIYTSLWSSGIYRTNNAGGRWERVINGLSSKFLHDIIDLDDDVFAVSSFGGGVYRLPNHGTTWQISSAGLPSINFSAITKIGRTLMIGSGNNDYNINVNGKIFTSSNAGKSWTEATQFETVRIHLLASHGSKVFAVNDGGRAFISSDTGRIWNRMVTPGFFVHHLLLVNNRIYIATDQGVFVSENDGDSWRQKGWTRRATRLCIADTTLFATTPDGVYMLRNEKDSLWIENNSGLKEDPNLILGNAKNTIISSGKYIFMVQYQQPIHRLRYNFPLFPAQAELTIPDTLSAFVGQEVVIPIKIKNGAYFFGTKPVVNVTLRCNASVLQPNFTPADSATYYAEDGQLFIQTKFNVQEQSGSTVKSLRFRAMIGNSVATPIFITNIESDSAAVIVRSPGIFTLKQFSEVGGTRSFRSAEAAATLVALPNPVQDVLTMKYFVVEEGTTTITVVDVMGRTVKTLESGTMQQGWQTKTFPINDVPSGTYFLMLQTPTALKVQRMEVQR